jgi:hypothetical protein
VADTVDLPGSAADLDASPAPDLGAYLRNPIADKPMLTPAEAVKAIAMLATMLEADDTYRAQIAAREVPDGI